MVAVLSLGSRRDTALRAFYRHKSAYESRFGLLTHVTMQGEIPYESLLIPIGKSPKLQIPSFTV